MNPASASFLAILLAFPLSAQKAPVTPTRPNTPTGPSLPSSPNNPANNPNTNNTNNNNPNNTNSNIGTMPRPIYLSGKVVLQDGTPPPDPVRIERICNGNPRPQGYTDSKGRFQFQVDSAIGVQADASDSTFNPGGGSGFPQRGQSSSLSRELAGCDLRAVLPGYISGTVTLSSHNSFDNPDVGIIVLKRAGNVDGTTISMTSLSAPKDAQKAYDKGRDALRKEKSDEAQKNFQKAVDLYPKYAAAWLQLGLLQNASDPSAAENSFTQSLQADSKFMRPYVELTLIFERSRRWEKAVETSTKAIRLNATDFPELHFYRAVAQFNLQDVDGAEKSVREAVKLDTRHQIAQAEKLLGVILIQKRDLPGAAEHLRNYLAFAKGAGDTEAVQKQLAQIDKEAFASNQK